ncbi:hypothetical protein BH09MYX1_BH09MYX1_00860 [soil metagenome]
MSLHRTREENKPKSRKAAILIRRAEALEEQAAADRGLAALEERDHDHDEWVSQDDSPLGRFSHLRAVRSGKLSGRRVGKKVLVRRSDLDAYIESAEHRPKVVQLRPSTTSDLRAELGLEQKLGAR